MSQQTFRKWKPGVWAALSTGLYTLEDDPVADETSGDNEDLSRDTCTFVSCFYQDPSLPSALSLLKGGTFVIRGLPRVGNSSLHIISYFLWHIKSTITHLRERFANSKIHVL